jgi:hypothetical protein
MRAKEGQVYCGEHLVHGNSSDDKRIPCPYDPAQYILCFFYLFDLFAKVQCSSLS